MNKKVFISYDYSSDVDKAFKSLLAAWDVGSGLDFLSSEHDGSLTLNAPEAVSHKEKISKMIAESNAIICIMGKNAPKSAWVTWEVMQAVTLRKKVIRIQPSMQVGEAINLIKKQV
jgi:hypothetical protein